MQSTPTAERSGRQRATVALLAGVLIIAVTLLVALRVREPGVNTRPVSDAREDASPDANPQPKSGSRFDPVRLVGAQPAIRNAPFIPAGKVRTEVSENELVLGVVINDEARAYPINMLTGPSREIINDTLGGKAIAATW